MKSFPENFSNTSGEQRDTPLSIVNLKRRFQVLQLYQNPRCL